MRRDLCGLKIYPAVVPSPFDVVSEEHFFESTQ